MLPIDLSGKRAFIAGVADDGGFGFAIAKAFAEAGASVSVGTWPPALGIFLKMLERGKMEESMALSDGRKLEFEKIYPLDAAYDTLSDAPTDVLENKRYKEQGDFTIEGLTASLRHDFGDKGLDIVVHSLANGPEVKKQLVDTSRAGYLTAVGVSAYSNISLVRNLAPMMRPGGSFLSLTYMAGERVVPGYGGGMSSAKAALEADTRTLAFEAGRRWGVRINTISAGPLASRAATRDRLHRHHDPVHRGEQSPAPSPRGGRGGRHRRIPRKPPRRRDHRQRGVRGQRLPCDGHGRFRGRHRAASRFVTSRHLVALGATMAGLAVAAGAFGAHALRARLAPADLLIFETGARYQMYHGLALIAAGWVAERGPPARGRSRLVLPRRDRALLREVSMC